MTSLSEAITALPGAAVTAVSWRAPSAPGDGHRQSHLRLRARRRHALCRSSADPPRGSAPQQEPNPQHPPHHGSRSLPGPRRRRLHRPRPRPAGRDDSRAGGARGCLRPRTGAHGQDPRGARSRRLPAPADDVRADLRGIGFADNPFGVGFNIDSEAPNILDPAQPQRPACFAPLGRALSPAQAAAGTPRRGRSSTARSPRSPTISTGLITRRRRPISAPSTSTAASGWCSKACTRRMRGCACGCPTPAASRAFMASRASGRRRPDSGAHRRHAAHRRRRAALHRGVATELPRLRGGGARRPADRGRGRGGGGCAALARGERAGTGAAFTSRAVGASPGQERTRLHDDLDRGSGGSRAGEQPSVRGHDGGRLRPSGHRRARDRAALHQRSGLAARRAKPSAQSPRENPFGETLAEHFDEAPAAQRSVLPFAQKPASAPQPAAVIAPLPVAAASAPPPTGAAPPPAAAAPAPAAAAAPASPPVVPVKPTASEVQWAPAPPPPPPPPSKPVQVAPTMPTASPRLKKGLYGRFGR